MNLKKRVSKTHRERRNLKYCEEFRLIKWKVRSYNLLQATNDRIKLNEIRTASMAGPVLKRWRELMLQVDAFISITTLSLEDLARQNTYQIEVI